MIFQRLRRGAPLTPEAAGGKPRNELSVISPGNTEESGKEDRCKNIIVKWMPCFKSSSTPFYNAVYDTCDPCGGARNQHRGHLEVVVGNDLNQLVPQSRDVHSLGDLGHEAREVHVVNPGMVEQPREERLVLEAVLDQAVPQIFVVGLDELDRARDAPDLLRCDCQQLVAILNDSDKGCLAEAKASIAWKGRRVEACGGWSRRSKVKSKRAPDSEGKRVHSTRQRCYMVYAKCSSQNRRRSRLKRAWEALISVLGLVGPLVKVGSGIGIELTTRPSGIAHPSPPPSEKKQKSSMSFPISSISSHNTHTK